MMATATAPAIAREILEDRYDAAVDKRTEPGSYSRVGQTLANAVYKLVVRTARVKGRELEGSGGVEEAVMAAIRATIIRELEQRGLAR